MLCALGRADDELSILICDDAEIRNLNRRYRRQNRSTDVLSFPQSPAGKDVSSPALLGDVVISIDTARKEAAQSGTTLLDTMTMLLAHGILHLLKHEHRNSDELNRMRRLTNTLVAAVGKKPPSTHLTQKDTKFPELIHSEMKKHWKQGAARKAKVRPYLFHVTVDKKPENPGCTKSFHRNKIRTISKKFAVSRIRYLF